MKEPQRFQHNALAIALTSAVVFLATPAQAQVAPDAGQTLQQLKPPIAAPRESKPLSIQTPVTSGFVLPGGSVVVVQTVSFADNSVINQDSLQAALGDVAGKSFDLAGLRDLAELISEFYHASGFPFARAVLPPQDMQQGALRIEIIEGRYGLVQATSEETALATQATPFLVDMKPGDVIESAALERASLLLKDQPGIEIVPVIRPGTQAGTGDLIVQVTRDVDKRVTGDVGLDNAGNRYTGQTRARANLDINSPFMLGDQIRINALVTKEQLMLGTLGYSLPLGASGLRGNVSYSITRYVLGKEFANLQANGTAQVASAELSYPLVRSQKTNLTLSSTYQTKALQDSKDSTNIHESKSSQSVPITLQFDNRDNVGGGGVTYGSVGSTLGKLKLDAAALDSNNTRGSFNKFNLDLVRLQFLSAGFSLMGRVSLQSTNKNLDSSEKMVLGGAGGVRAYPSGEASGDAGVLTQLELRYNTGSYTPYVFVDGGSIKTNVKPAPAVINNTRNLSGSGFGLRYQRVMWSVDSTLAWRNTGGTPQADTSSDPKPRIWVNLGCQF